jgi:outer membrane biosynthesis protein TonB
LTRSAAAAQIEKSRDLYSQIAKDTATDPILLREALLSAAKAEESLVGIPKTDNPTETRGNLDRALEWYQELANRYPDSFQGKEAAKRAKEIQTNKQQIVDFYRLLAKTFAPPELPKLPDAPKVETPKIDIPKPDPLKTETPKGDVPKLDLPKSDSPKTETPKVEPKKEEPKLEPKKEEPKKNAPKTVDPKAGSAK